MKVALRKESVDRNSLYAQYRHLTEQSLSARRAWIEIAVDSASGTLSDTSLSARRAWIEIVPVGGAGFCPRVALRKESVDRNFLLMHMLEGSIRSLSARRAWIEIIHIFYGGAQNGVALRKESVDRNLHQPRNIVNTSSRSPQGERG